MKRILGCFAIVVLMPILALVILGLILPRNWSVDRSVTIDASVAEVYTIISDFHRWPEWVKLQAPGSKIETEFNFSGPASGAGSVLHWNSTDSAIGTGRFTMVESNPGTGIRYEVIVESQQLDGKGSIQFQKVEAGTLVTWHDEGELAPIIGGLMSWIYEAGTGARFEDDLARLKALLEAGKESPAVEIPAGK